MLFLNNFKGLLSTQVLRLIGANISTPNNARSLYAATALGIDGFINTRDKIKAQFTNSIDNFKEKMEEFSNDPKGMIFTEDLKNMIHLAENEKDVVLVNNMIRKFNAQGKEIRFGNYIFGPVVMRLFYHLNEHKTALASFTEESMNGFFDQLISYQILLDMLYNHEMYDDVLKTFEIIKSRQVQGGRYPKHVVVLTFAACYKQNTPESLQYATNLWKELNEVGHIPMRKAATFAAALAIAQNAPHIGLEILGTIKQQSYVTVRNLKVVALASLQRTDEVIRILKSVLEESVDSQTKHTFCGEVIQLVTTEFQRSGNPGPIADLEKIVRLLEKNGHITNTKINDILCSEITSTSQSAMPKERRMMASSFSKNNNYNQNNNNNRTFRQRPGLGDLY